jgi:anti-anti-sigma regulatory factor
MPISCPQGQILYAQTDNDVVVVRVIGRGNFDLSPSLKRVFERFSTAHSSPRYIIDLAQCPSLDSTFMGMIAAMGLRQITCIKERIVVLNTCGATGTQLLKLGLKHLLDIRGKDQHAASVSDSDFETSQPGALSRFEKTVHMIESHQALIDADSGNEVQFRPVIESLSASLDREKRTQSSR